MDMSCFFSLLQGLGLLAFAPLFLGWLNWWKASLTGRKRPLMWVIQPYRDLLKSMRLPPTYAQTTSWIFRLTPYLIFAIYSSLLFTVSLTTRSILSPDLLLILYLLGLGRFSLSLAGLDSASSFGNLGSNREMLFHFLTEVSLFPAIAALLLWANAPDKGQPLFWLAALAILMSFFPILLLEARRLPVDNPETHLELTMAGKAVELEFSGRDPALVKWGEMNKLLFLTALWSQGLFWLVGVEVASWWLALLLYAGLWLLTASGLAAWEWRTPKIRLGHIPTVARASLFFSLFAILLRLIPGG